MPVFSENLNILWSSLIIEELVRNEVEYFCISPGSRSAPLAVGVGRNPAARYQIIYDERAAAFYALGYARARGKPAVLICTSGTAIANYYPAVVEASLDGIPMIILSADRPPEKIETGANQTIRQSGFFGDYVRWQFDLPCPVEDIPPEFVLTTIDHALHRATSAPRGPVHLNCPFRDPLPPLKKSFSGSYLDSVRSWLDSEDPFTQHSAGEKSLAEPDFKNLLDLIRTTRRGLLVAGRLKSDADRLAVERCSRTLNWPIFADVLSGLRLGNHRKNLLPYFDLMLLSEKMQEELRPETIIHFGDQPASKRFLQFVEKVKPADYVLIQANPFRSDPGHRVTWRIEGHVSRICQDMPARLESSLDLNWQKQLHRLSREIGSLIDHRLSQRGDICEPAVSRMISRHLPAGHALFLANSLPIREMDMFADTTGESVRVTCNRGVSGIDGTIASATGFARGLDRPVTLLVGDLAFLHDLNSLALLADLPRPLTIVLLNNGGGGIFSFLPIARFPEVFEPFFGTPHSLNFENAARLFHLAYCSPETPADLLLFYQQALQQKQSTLIEIRTGRQENFDLHQEIFKKIITRLDELIKR